MPQKNSPNSSGPNRLAPGHSGWWIGALGACLGIALTGAVTLSVLGAGATIPWLLAPMGASAFLVFMVPASPLAQPWPVMGGHLVSALIGMLVHASGVTPWLGAAIAVGSSIAAMGLLRCPHPPAGGTTLVTALAGPAIMASGWHFLLMPLGLNIAVLLGFALAWNRLTGHSYPHRAMPISPPRAWVGHIEDGDLDAVLAEWDELLDVSRKDLLALLHATEAQVLDRIETPASKRGIAG